MKIVKQVINYLKAGNITISFAESITGGLLAAQLIPIPGVSQIHKSSVITYSSEQKVKLLGVSPNTISENGVISEAVAFEMCQGLFNLSDASLCVAITGNAGPTFDKGSNTLESYLVIKYHAQYYHYHLDYNSQNRKALLKKLVKIVYQLIANLLVK